MLRDLRFEIALVASAFVGLSLASRPNLRAMMVADLDDCVSQLHAQLIAPENAAEICASLLGDARRRLEEDGGSFAHFDNPQDYTNLLLSLACMLCAALAAGLTMGVVSLEEVDLRVKLRCGTAEE